MQPQGGGCHRWLGAAVWRQCPQLMSGPGEGLRPLVLGERAPGPTSGLVGIGWIVGLASAWTT